MSNDEVIRVSSRSFKLLGEFDVVVCDGGPSGVIAATAAARLGARTILLERNGFLGGMATAAEVTQILRRETLVGEKVVKGFPAELLNRVESGQNYPGAIAFSPDSFKHEADWLVADSRPHSSLGYRTPKEFALLGHNTDGQIARNSII